MTNAIPTGEAAAKAIEAGTAVLVPNPWQALDFLDGWHQREENRRFGQEVQQVFHSGTASEWRSVLIAGRLVGKEAFVRRSFRRWMKRTGGQLDG